MEQEEIDSVEWEGEPQVSQLKFTQLFGFALITKNELVNSRCRTAMNKSIFKDYRTHDAADDDPCKCQPESDGKRCKDDSCEKRAVQMECPTKCGKHCSNSPFRNASFKTKFQLAHRTGRGFGLLTRELILPKDYIVEFIGQIYLNLENPLRKTTIYACDIKMHNSTRAEDQLVIEPTFRGNVARYSGHSCNPNCEMVTMFAGQELRNVLVATKKISPGMEIVWDYGKHVKRLGILSCLCLEPNQCKNYDNALLFLANHFAMLINQLFINEVSNRAKTYRLCHQYKNPHFDDLATQRVAQLARHSASVSDVSSSPMEPSSPPASPVSSTFAATPPRYTRSPNEISQSPHSLPTQGTAAIMQVTTNTPDSDSDDSIASDDNHGDNIRGAETQASFAHPTANFSGNVQKNIRRSKRTLVNITKTKEVKRKAVSTSSDSSFGDQCTPTAKYQKGGTKQSSKRISTLKGKSRKVTPAPSTPHIIRSCESHSPPCEGPSDAPTVFSAKKSLAPTCGQEYLVGAPSLLEEPEQDQPRRRGRPRTRPPTPPSAAEQPRNPRGRPRKNPSDYARKCEYCGRPFQHAGNYASHVRYKHSNARKYKCTLCPMTFKSEQDLVRHQRTHKPSDQQIRYGCPSCNATYSRAEDVTVHQRNPLNDCPEAEATVIQPKKKPKRKKPRSSKNPRDKDGSPEQ